MRRKRVAIDYNDDYRINAIELHKRMRQYHIDMENRCLFLYTLMSNKMDFIINPTKKDIKHLKDITEALDYVW